MVLKYKNIIALVFILLSAITLAKSTNRRKVSLNAKINDKGLNKKMVDVCSKIKGTNWFWNGEKCVTYAYKCTSAIVDGNRIHCENCRYPYRIHKDKFDMNYCKKDNGHWY